MLMYGVIFHIVVKNIFLNIDIFLERTKYLLSFANIALFFKHANVKTIIFCY